MLLACDRACRNGSTVCDCEALDRRARELLPHARHIRANALLVFIPAKEQHVVGVDALIVRVSNAISHRERRSAGDDGRRMDETSKLPRK